MFPYVAAVPDEMSGGPWWRDVRALANGYGRRRGEREEDPNWSCTHSGASGQEKSVRVKDPNT
jgi:hypothetical protein